MSPHIPYSIKLYIPSMFAYGDEAAHMDGRKMDEPKNPDSSYVGESGFCMPSQLTTPHDTIHTTRKE